MMLPYRQKKKLFNVTGSALGSSKNEMWLASAKEEICSFHP
jgi:hypothetical protein